MSDFYCLEAAMFRNFADAVGPADLGYLAAPHLALCEIEASPSASSFQFMSDQGYVTLSTDPAGVVPYPPTVEEAFQVDTSANLDPTRSAVAASWGTIILENVDRRWDTLVSTWETDGLTIRILRGTKTWDATRGIMVDPPYATLVQVFVGVMGQWRLTPTSVEIPLRDATYFLEKAVPRNLYTGAGGYNGDSGLAGTAKPIVLGAVTGATPSVKNITPLLIDATNLIYQYHDGPADLAAMYDGGYAGYTASGDTTNLYSGTTPSGHYRTNTARGLFQIGNTAQFGVTCDADSPLTGRPIVARVAMIALGLMQVPGQFIGSADGSILDFIGPDARNTYLMSNLRIGLYLGSTEIPDGVNLMSRLLGCINALLVPCRDGKLRAYCPAAVPVDATALQTFDDTNIVDIRVETLPSSVSPPPWRARVACDLNWTVNTSALAGAVTAAQRSWLAQPYRVGFSAATPAALLQMSRSVDMDVIGVDGGVIDIPGATSVAQAVIALFGPLRKLYTLTVPATVGEALDWGSVVKVVSTFDGLDSGKLGQITGWSMKTTDATSTFRVLV